MSDGRTLPVVPLLPHAIQVDGKTCRRILDDGSIVGYPRTLDASFRHDGVELQLDRDGCATCSLEGPHGGTAEHGRYDLHDGYVHLTTWGGTRTIELLPQGDLRVGEDRLRPVRAP